MEHCCAYCGKYIELNENTWVDIYKQGDYCSYDRLPICKKCSIRINELCSSSSRNGPVILVEYKDRAKPKAMRLSDYLEDIGVGVHDENS